MSLPVALDTNLLVRLLTRHPHVFGDARITLEVAVHVLLRGGALEVELAREAEG